MRDDLDTAAQKAMATRRSQFARNLRRALAEKGWNQSDLARRASDMMPDGKAISKQTISHFVNGLNLPSSRTMMALATALGLKPSDLDPAPDTSWLDTETRPMGSHKDEEKPMLTIDSLDGMASLNIVTKVPVETALRIIAILNEAGVK